MRRRSSATASPGINYGRQPPRACSATCRATTPPSAPTAARSRRSATRRLNTHTAAGAERPPSPAPPQGASRPSRRHRSSRSSRAAPPSSRHRQEPGRSHARPLEQLAGPAPQLPQLPPAAPPPQPQRAPNRSGTQRPPRLPTRTMTSPTSYHRAVNDDGRSRAGSLAASPTMVGAITTLIVIVAVFLAYNANNGLPFVPIYRVSAEICDAARLGPNNEVGSAATGSASSSRSTPSRAPPTAAARRRTARAPRPSPSST